MKNVNATAPATGFVAVNFIACRDDYRPRFEELFATRAHAIDGMPGFVKMQVLKPASEGEPYLVVSEWKDETAFHAWTGSPEFLEGHRRAFSDLKEAKERGEESPMSSRFVTYAVVAR